VDPPDLIRSLALVLVQRPLLHVANLGDVEEENGLEADGLLIGKVNGDSPGSGSGFSPGGWA
jgi:hypothetical protein